QSAGQQEALPELRETAELARLARAIVLRLETIALADCSRLAGEIESPPPLGGGAQGEGLPVMDGERVQRGCRFDGLAQGGGQCPAGAGGVQGQVGRKVETGGRGGGQARVAGQEWVVGSSQESGMLAGEEEAIVAHPIRRMDEIGQVPAAGPELREDRTEG